MSALIRAMELKDLPEVLQLAQELGYPSLLDEFVQRWSEIESSENHSLWVISHDKIAGWMHLEIVLDLIEEKKCELKAIIVKSDQRNSGLGKELVNFAKTWAKEKQLNTIYLSCNIIREEAHHFYEREGFVKSKTSHFYETEV